MNNTQRCNTCKYWTKAHTSNRVGDCNSPQALKEVRYEVHEDELDLDQLSFVVRADDGSEAYRIFANVGPLFGCIHHAEKEHDKTRTN